MTEYVVYRRGWNAANQSSRACPETVEVHRCAAATPAEAVDRAAAAGVTCYHNQTLWATPLAEVLQESEAVRAVIDGFFPGGAPDSARIGTYRPNGGQPTWAYHDVEDDPQAVGEVLDQDWESAEVRDGELALFRHDGPVLHYQSVRPLVPQES